MKTNKRKYKFKSHKVAVIAVPFCFKSSIVYAGGW